MRKRYQVWYVEEQRDYPPANYLCTFDTVGAAINHMKLVDRPGRIAFMLEVYELE